jgi:quercetin dioxygenase-like cupin family protein
MKTKFLPFAVGILVGSMLLLIIQSLLNDRKSSSEVLPTPFYTTLFENEEIRILEHTINPGEKEPKHSHPSMYAYFIEDTEVTVTVETDGSDGSESVRSFQAGENFLVPAVRHSIENTGNKRLHTILVELK